MAIFKAKIESNYAIIPNSALQDKSISFEATGLLAMMLSLPDDWEIHKSWLQQQKVKCGRDKLTSIMNELVVAGYVRKKIKQSDGGKLNGVDWLVYPSSTVQLKNRKTAEPSDGKSDTTKETSLQSKHLTNSFVPSKTKRSKFKFNDDDLRFANEMFNRVLVINPSAKKPNFESWANTIRLMREVDNRTHHDMWVAFDWANKDSFWCSNILSPDKLRKQFDKLTVKINETSRPSNKPSQYDGLSDSKRAMLQAREKRDAAKQNIGSILGENDRALLR